MGDSRFNPCQKEIEKVRKKRGKRERWEEKDVEREKKGWSDDLTQPYSYTFTSGLK